MGYFLNPFIGGGVTELYRDTSVTTSTANNANYTLAAMAIGAASATRQVYALIASTADANPGRSISTVTIGGVSATIHAQINASDGLNSMISAIASATVPTGTTGDVVVSHNNNMTACNVAIVALDNLVSTTPVDTMTAEDAGGGDADASGTIDFPAGGYVIAVTNIDDGAGTATISWTGLDEMVASTAYDVPGGVCGMGYRNVRSGDGVNVTVTATWSLGNDISLAAISVR